jgi:N-acetylglutamate synthase-like GNAT family acetyltransferase
VEKKLEPKIPAGKVKRDTPRKAKVMVAKRPELIGLVALECEFIGNAKDQLQVVFLHVDAAHRDQGIGTTLMNKVKNKAKKLGAQKLYISATPSEHTINFYFNLGCKLATEINSELYELEPDDIHLELIV